MNQQLSIFEPRTLARSTDPQTSHEAAERVHEFASGHRKIIRDALRQHGPLTVDEIAKYTALQSQQINKRLPELQRDHLAEPTDERRLSASGRPARVWRVIA